MKGGAFHAERHLVTPIPCHAEQTVRVLEAGKHCACTVPMATSLEDLARIAQAKRKSGKKYMMMETTLYTYQFSPGACLRLRHDGSRAAPAVWQSLPGGDGHLCLDNGLKAEATRSLFECARIYQEGMFVYGSKASFEWGFADGDKPL